MGSKTMTIADVVTAEPDRPVNFFALGPRVFVHADDLERINLVGQGSRVRYKRYLKLTDPSAASAIQTQLKQGLSPDVSVDTFRTAPSRIKRFFDQFFFFLRLITLLTLVLAGIGIQSTLNAFVAQKRVTIAIMKTVGATNRFVTTYIMVIVALLAVCGIVLGVIGGFGLQLVLPTLFAPLLQVTDTPIFFWRPVLEGLLGLVVVAICAFLPLRRSRKIKPLALFRPKAPIVLSKQRYLIIGSRSFLGGGGSPLLLDSFPHGYLPHLGDSFCLFNDICF